MSYIILARNPMNKMILAMTDENGEIKEFENEVEADDLANEHPLFSAWGYQIVEAY